MADQVYAYFHLALISVGTPQNNRSTDGVSFAISHRILPTCSRQSRSKRSMGMTPQPISSQTTIRTLFPLRPAAQIGTDPSLPASSGEPAYAAHTKPVAQKLCPGCTLRRPQYPGLKSPAAPPAPFSRCGNLLRSAFLSPIIPPKVQTAKTASSATCKKKPARSPVMPPNCFLHRRQNPTNTKPIVISTAAPSHKNFQTSSAPASKR